MAATWPRTEMMKAALEGGLAFQKGLGAVHSLSHALGAIRQLKLRHGTPQRYPEANRGVVKAPAVDDKIDRLLSAMGSPATPLAYELDGLKRRLRVLPTSGAVG